MKNFSNMNLCRIIQMSHSEGLISSSQPQNKVQCGLFLDVVVRESTAIFQLFSCKYQPLLVGWDTFFVLDLGLDVLDGVRGLHLQGDGFASESFDKNLHSSSQSEN